MVSELDMLTITNHFSSNIAILNNCHTSNFRSNPSQEERKMYKASTALFLYAETSVHAGSGESLGAIDLAIQRERHTHFPCVAAQGVKGSIRDWFEHAQKRGLHAVDTEHVLAAFGPDTKDNPSEHAGSVAFTDARLLLFPVRSMKGIFAWVTCPFAIGRLKRDLGMTGASDSLSWNEANPPVQPGRNTVWGVSEAHACKTQHQSRVLLEEEVFTFEKAPASEGQSNLEQFAVWLATAAFPQTSEYDHWRNAIPSRLLLLNDDDFRHFVKTALEIQARVALGEGKSTDTSKGGNLFYQENLPSDSLLYSMVLTADSMRAAVNEDADAMLSFAKKLDGKRMQIGGDETTGKGYVYAHFMGSIV